MDETQQPGQHEYELSPGLHPNLPYSDKPQAGGRPNYAEMLGGNGAREVPPQDPLADQMPAGASEANDGAAAATSEVPGAEPGQLNKHELIGGDDATLLGAESLERFADKAAVDAEIKSGDAATAEKLTAVQNLVERRIFGTEQAVVVAKELSLQSAAVLGPEVATVKQSYDKLKGVLGVQAFDQFVGGIQGALAGIRELEDVIRGERKFERHHGEIIKGLGILVATYEAERNIVKQASTAGQDNARDGRIALEKASQTGTSWYRRTEAGIQESLDSPDSSAFPQAAKAVLARGKKTLEDHTKSCEAEYSVELDKIGEVAAAIVQIEPDAQNILVKMSDVYTKADALPHPQQLEVDYKDMLEAIGLKPGRPIEEISPERNRYWALEKLSTLESTLRGFGVRTTELREIIDEARRRSVSIDAGIGRVTAAKLFRAT